MSNLLYCGKANLHTAKRGDIKRIILRSNANYPPYDINALDGDVSGIHIDMVNAVSQ